MNTRLEYNDELAGSPSKVNTSSNAFLKLRAAIETKSNRLSKEEKKGIELNAIKYKMMNYLEGDSDTIVPVGAFIKQYLRVAHVRQKSFATYIHWDKGNLTKLLTGTRKINHELAMILGSTFRMNAVIWLQIQDKNELVKLKSINQGDYKDYSLDRLYEIELKE